MEYEKIDDTSNKTSEFRIKNWVEINDESRGAMETMLAVQSNLKLLC